MMALNSPHETYRRVDFDARVAVADPAALVGVCFEQLTGAIGTALFAEKNGDAALKSQSLTRALTAVTALQMGISEDNAVGLALRQLYDAARQSILDSAIQFDSGRLQNIRSDFIEIGEAFRTA